MKIEKIYYASEERSLDLSKLAWSDITVLSSKNSETVTIKKDRFGIFNGAKEVYRHTFAEKVKAFYG